jgi:PAS domain S-box-containing protein
MNEVEKLKKELEIQKNIAYTAGVLQGDVTIKTLLESLAEGVVITRQDGCIVLINDRMAKMTGYTKEEVMGEKLSLFIPQNLHEKHASHINKFFSEPRIRPMGIGHELIAVRKDKSTFPVEISLSYLDIESGRLGIAFITDITERKLLQDDLKKKNAELESYATTVAHDLTSSASGVLQFADLLINSGSSFTEQEKETFLKNISQSGKKMVSIIRELLIFSTIKKEDIKLSKIDMKEIVQSVLDRLSVQIEKQSVQIIYSAELMDCIGYAPWIEEVMFNFVSNAIKYGGKPPKIEIKSQLTDDGFVKYSVTDNGLGIDPEFQKIIFEEKNKNKDKLIRGYGLGLSIVKKIIEKLDGYVEVESEKGKGSTFSFYMKNK